MVHIYRKYNCPSDLQAHLNDNYVKTAACSQEQTSIKFSQAINQIELQLNYYK